MFLLMISFMVALALVLVAMPKVIPYLHKLKFGQVEREEGLASHKKKGGTPTMGGVVFIIATVIAAYICHYQNFMNPYVNLLTFALVGFGFIGFIDDYLIVAQHSNKGLKPSYKYAMQSVVAVVFYFLAKAYLPNFSTEIIIPIAHISVNLGWFYPVFVYFMFTAESNAVNLTDGLDGLATGLMIIALTPFVAFAILSKNIEAALFGAALMGGLTGFLVFNAHPAKIFMGDCGSLALGGILAAFAVITKQELLVLIIGIVPLIETLSVCIQVISFKTRGKRVFKMAPIHHHFEMCGWSENKVVVTFWAVGFIAGIIGLLLGVL